MSDNELALSDRFNAPVVFVNEVAGIGFINGVVNVTLATAQFTPQGGKSKEVLADLTITSRLRMDLYCAQQLHMALGDIIEKNTKGPSQPKPKMDS